MLAILIEEPEINPIFQQLVIFLFFIGLCAFIAYRLYILLEQIYASRFKKPLFTKVQIIPRRLNKEHRYILSKNFVFYNKLKASQQRHFEHRLIRFMKSKKFVGREGFDVTDEVRILISATAIMLTFGFRNYRLEIFNTIVVYPSIFYSKTNDVYHKGEFNPRHKIIAFSWQDFVEGYHITNDNMNLGIHEFAHVIHLNSLRATDISARIFADAFKELTDYITENEPLRSRLIASEYFRDYAFTNQFEFLAVIIESFIETPKEFQQHFPTVYKKNQTNVEFQLCWLLIFDKVF